MSHLIQYLNENFSGAYDLDLLKKRFRKEFGIYAKEKAPYLLFKYAQYKANWDNQITHECRGIIVRQFDDGWKVLCRPFDKFFNQHEEHCIIHENTIDFKSIAHELRLAEKADGSCITLWNCHESGWNISTLGSIETTIIYGGLVTFASMFLRILFQEEISLEKASDVFDAILDKDVTYIFEACGNENRIVTVYDSERVYLLGARHRQTGITLPEEKIQQIHEKLVNQGLGLKLPYTIKLQELNVQSLHGVQRYMELQEKDTWRFGEIPEGFVLYRGCQPVSKLKNQAYLVKHRHYGADTISLKRIKQSVFNGEIDDVMHLITPSQKEFLCRVITQIGQLTEDMLRIFTVVQETPYESRKEYVSIIRETTKEKGLVSFFMSQYRYIESDRLFCIEEHFEDWLKEGHKWFEWK